MSLSAIRHKTDPFIFASVAILVAIIVMAALGDTEATRTALFGLENGIVEDFAWFLSMTVTFLLGVAVWLAFSRWGHVKLGPDDCEPDYGYVTWLSMLYSAGMGIGLVFYGVAEPVLHFIEPLSAAPSTPAAAREAMRYSVFHWGFHAWGIYAILGLSLALNHFRYGQPLAMRSTLEPLLGDRTHMWQGKMIDVLAVLGTLFGLATSLGLGAAQVEAGINNLFGFDGGLDTQIGIIVVITFFATMSLVLGLDKGIRRLSEFNMLLAALLMVFVLLAGPTAAMLRGIPDNLGNYLQNLPSMSLNTQPFGNLEWEKTWTIFYWAWWLSWAPFVGMFIARISRGRTIREFLAGVLLLPTVLSLLWFGIFGGAALHIELGSAPTDLAATVTNNAALAIYALLEHYPYASITTFLAIVLVAVFFITSSDSGSFVVDMLTSGGNPNPPVIQRVFWASLEGILAIILLLTGGLNALQAGAVSMGLPFSLVLIGVVVALLKKLYTESHSQYGLPTRPQ